MTQRELHKSFLAQIHNYDIDSQYEFQTHEIEIFLAKSYRQVVDKYYSVFEKDEKARKILSKLVNVVQVTSITTTTDYYNGYKVDLTGVTPTILYNLSEECILELTHPSTTLVKPVTLDAYAANVDNPFKKPWKNLVWRLDVGDGTQQVILIATSTVLAYNLTYLRQPETIDVTSTSSILINEEAHNDIVDRAVQLALQSIQINSNLKQSK